MRVSGKLLEQQSGGSLKLEMPSMCCLIGSSLQLLIPQITSSSWIFSAVKDRKVSSMVGCAVGVSSNQEILGKGEMSGCRYFRSQGTTRVSPSCYPAEQSEVEQIIPVD